MRDFGGKVAVVTGAASGIGYAMAERLAREGMKVAMADLDPRSLDAARRRLESAGHEVRAFVTDVSSADSVQDLAKETLKAWNTIHLVCNNAGIGGGAADRLPVWETDPSVWTWALGVNLWGVIHGIRTFVPILLAHGEEAHVVNTASRAGLVSGWGLYGVTKHAVVALSECLSAQLQLAGASIGVTVLCPSAVKSNLMRSGDSAPADARGEETGQPARSGSLDFMKRYRDLLEARVAAGREPHEIAELMLDAIRHDRFYVLSSKDEEALVRDRLENILARRRPMAPRLPG